VAAAKKEGQLTVIALPRNWVNYGEAIDTFSKKYGIKVNELNPDGGSGDEIEAIKVNKDNKGPQAPDVIDVGFSFGPDAKKAGLLAPYKVATWSSIPDSVKDADGSWYGDYYGALSFEVNLDVVKTPPLDWPDLLGTAFKGQVALTGDPRVSNQAIMSVAAAAVANGGGFDNAKPGLDFFSKLNAAGNFVPLIAKTGTLVSGETPVAITWDYLAMADRDTADGTEHRRDRAGNRRRGGSLRPGNQRICAASQRCPSPGGVPLLRRRAAHLAQGLRPPRPLCGHGHAKRHPRRRRREAPSRILACEGHLPVAGSAGHCQGGHRRRLGLSGRSRRPEAAVTWGVP
jgi:hypothetical protein